MTPMNPRFLPSILGLLLWILAPATVAAQAPQNEPLETGFSERIEVEIVNVDVWVTDSQGNPVTGLDADSFQILHDDEPVPITHFTEVRGGGAVPPSATASGALEPGREISPIAATPGHVVVYFDQSRLHPSRYPALIRSLEEFLQSEAIPSERVLILRQDRGLSVEAAFGSSRKELAQALERLAKGTASGLDLETETRLALDAIRESWEQSQDLSGSAAGGLGAVPSTAGTGQPPGSSSGATGIGGPRAVVGGVGSGAGPDACGMFVNQIQPIIDSWTRSNSYRIGVTLTNLSSTAGFLAGLPGVKALLYLSDGLETQPGADLATYASGLCPAAGTDLITGTLAAQMTSGFLDLTRHANTNRVTIYSLQTSGLQALDTGDASRGRRARGGSGARARSSFEASKRAADREGLGLIASETGGRAVYNQNDLGPELARIGNEIQNYYSLAYEPPARSTGARRRDHKIEVKVANSSQPARYRHGYLEKDQGQWLTERIEGALNLGLTSNPLAVRLGAGAVQEAAPGSYRMPLHVMVPVQHLAFLPDDGSFFADITLRVLARQVDGNTLISQDKSFRVQGSPEATGFADLTVELELGEGMHLTAIGVQDTNTREASFISTSLQIGPGG
jgi:VWFA-related protein